MSQREFTDLVGQVAAHIEGKPVDEALAMSLNSQFGPTSATFERLAALCKQGEAEGWLMQRSAEGIKFGRALKPGEIPGNLSVDVVRMADIKGPHHVHPTGEIGLVLPLEGDPQFDGLPEGWYVYPPGSDHHPTVAGGEAYVLYFLPDGAIEFTGR